MIGLQPPRHLLALAWAAVPQALLTAGPFGSLQAAAQMSPVGLDLTHSKATPLLTPVDTHTR